MTVSLGRSSDIKRRKTVPPTDTRMVVYVRQENEEIYTPLHLVPPTVPGLARAIESKYNVSANAIRCLYRRNKKSITAKLDDDLLKFYCNEDTFLMQVTAIELEGGEGHERLEMCRFLNEVFYFSKTLLFGIQRHVLVARRQYIHQVSNHIRLSIIPQN